MSKFCLTCGTPNASDFQSCRSCGGQLFAGSSDKPVPVPVPLAVNVITVPVSSLPINELSTVQKPLGTDPTTPAQELLQAGGDARSSAPGARAAIDKKHVPIVGAVVVAVVLGIFAFNKLGADRSNGSTSASAPPIPVATYQPPKVNRVPHPSETTQSSPTSNASPQAIGPLDAFNAPSVRVGDAYTYETLDLIEPKLNNVTTRTVVKAGSAGYQMSFVNEKSRYTRQLSYDSNLNLVSSRYGSGEGFDYSPPLQYFKFPLRAGDAWSSNSTESNLKTGKTRVHTLRVSVGSVELITVPAGTFNAIRISIESEVNDAGQISTGKDISWYSPDVRRTVLSVLESRDPSGKAGQRKVQLQSYRLQ